MNSIDLPDPGHNPLACNSWILDSVRLKYFAIAPLPWTVKPCVVMGILKEAEPYRSMVRMRNLIVHGYDVVDPEILFDAATKRLGDFRRFRDEIDLANARQESDTGGAQPTIPPAATTS